MAELLGRGELGHIASEPVNRLTGRIIPRHVGIGQRGNRFADAKDRARPNAAVDLFQFPPAFFRHGQ